MKIRAFLLLTISAFPSFAQNGQKTAVPIDLTCDYRTHPLGIDNRAPGLSWIIKTDARNWKQTAYQIIISADSAGLYKNTSLIWDSRKVISNKNIQIKYGGAALRSFMNCWWRVRVWDAAGNASSWSAPAYWKMGVLSTDDWKGKWIASDLKLKPYQVQLRSLPDFDMEPETDIWKRADSIRTFIHVGDTAPAVYMRKDFYLHKKVKRATAYVCGLGLHELYINGKRAGNEYLNPAYTDYQKTVLYNTYNITGYVGRGANALGVILGNGWYNQIVPHVLRFYTADYIDPPKLMMNLYIEYSDGTATIIASDNSWKYTTRGPIVYNDILSGETYDAQNEITGWDKHGYTDAGWRNCLSADSPKGVLTSQQVYPVVNISSTPAVKIAKTNTGYRFDLGKEICGWAGIKLHGKAGQKIKISYVGEGSHTLGRYQTHYYILKGGGDERYEPRFSYNGFRYVDVEGLDYTPEKTDLEGKLVATKLKTVGRFACSNEKLNQIQQILLNTIENYIVHIPNDPTREKSGWTQDVQNGFDVNAYNYDVASMYIKWQRDFNDIVFDNGYIPPVVPSRFSGHTINGPWWGGMIVYNVAKLSEYYQDEDIIEASYQPMKKWVGYLTSIAKDHIVEWGLGEWMEPFSTDGPRPSTTPVMQTSTIAYYYYTCKMAEFAKMLHKDADERYFTKLAADIKQSYNSKFFNEKTGQYALGSQASQLMSLYFDLVPMDKRELATGKLIEAINKRNGHLSTGFVATPLLLTTLSDLGLSEEAYAMATKEGFPGWYDMIFTKGNSVAKENWEGGLVQMPSLAGPIGYWYYHSLAGIQQAKGRNGFGELVIKPDFINELTWVSASYQSQNGEIESKWQKKDKLYRLKIKIPANTSALVYLPGVKTDEIFESNKKLKQQKDIQVKQVTDKETIVSVGSGRYIFTVLSH